MIMWFDEMAPFTASQAEYLHACIERKKKTKKELVLKGKPTHDQEQFFLAKGSPVCFSGDAGTGKSWALRRKLILMALKYPGLNILLLIKKGVIGHMENRSRLIEELGDICTHTSSSDRLIFPNGSILQLGFIGDADNDVFKFAGQRFDVIGIDDIELFAIFQVEHIKTCNCSTIKDFKPRLYYTCLPRLSALYQYYFSI